MTSSTNRGQSLAANGIDLHYDTSGEGTPLLLLHGFTGAGVDWRYVFSTPPDGYRLIIPDLRGHGRSTNPSGQFTFRQCAGDLLALLDHLQIDACQAIGLSGGAQALLHVATQQPRRVEAMVLVSTASYFPPQARAFMAQMTVESRSEEEWRLMRQSHVRGDEQIRRLWAQGHAFKDSYDDVNFTPPLLSTISARTLIVHGDRDPLYPVALAVECFEAIPRSALWIMPNAGHVPIFGAEKSAFVATALAFLRGQWGGR